MKKTYDGACHCGRLRVRYTTQIRPEDWQLRACDCSFCRRHGARTTTDPSGFPRVDGEARKSGEISSQFYYKKLDASYETNKADGRFSFVEVRREDDDYSGPSQTITAAEYDGKTLTMVQNWSDAYSETVTTSWRLSPEGGTRAQVEGVNNLP